MLTPAKRPIQAVWFITMAVSLVAVVAFCRRWLVLQSGRWFWDFSVYGRAVQEFNSGIDPYRVNVDLPFVYHPIVLRLFVMIDHWIPLSALLVVAYVSSAVWLAIELTLSLPKRRAGTPITGAIDVGIQQIVTVFLAAAAFDGIGTVSLMACNLTPFMHFTLIAALLHTNRLGRGRLAWLPILLILAIAVIKPYFLTYLVLGVALSRNKPLAVFIGGVVAAVALSSWVLYAHFHPVENAAFLRALQITLVNREDFGHSFYGVARKLGMGAVAAIAVHAAASVVLLAGALFVMARSLRTQPVPFASISALYLVLTIINPRMKEYDLFPAVCLVFLTLPFVTRYAAITILAAVLLGSLRLIGVFQSGLNPVLLKILGSYAWEGIALAAVSALLARVLWLRERRTGNSGIQM